MNWLQLALQAYQTYMATRDPKLKQVPEDPGMVALRQQLLKYIQNSPTRNMLGQMIQGHMSGTSNKPYQLPPGANGYNPYPGGQPTPQYDLSKIFPNLATADNPTPGAGAVAGAGAADPYAPLNRGF